MQQDNKKEMDVSGNFDPINTNRPVEALLTYYTLCAALTVIGFPFIFLPLYFRYKTLKYTFDDEGVYMSWGILFHKEIYLTYRRIQDIHVTRNFVQRWLGLAVVSVQTASGSAGMEMMIEGIEHPELLRDYLYSKMRGANNEEESSPNDNKVTAAELQSGTTEKTDIVGDDEVTELLRDIRDGIKDLRARLEEINS